MASDYAFSAELFRGLTVGLTCPEPPGQGRQFFLCTCVYLCSRFGGCASLLPVSGPVIFDRVGYLALNSWINVYHFTGQRSCNIWSGLVSRP